jgi:hypothetical protein
VTPWRNDRRRCARLLTAALTSEQLAAAPNRFSLMIGEGIDTEIEIEAVKQPARAILFLSDIHDPTVSRG